MRNDKHLIIGLFLFGLYSIPVLILTPITIPMSFWAFLVAAIGSVLPDRIEPPYHYTHRSFFHGTGMLRLCLIIFIITGLLTFLTIINGVFYYSYVVSGFFLGYASHLLADSTTKMSIPKTQWPKLVKKSKRLPIDKSGTLPQSGSVITDKDRKDAITNKEIGNNFYKKGNYEDALWFYERGLKIDPTNTDIIHNKDMALTKLGKFKK